MGSPTSKSPGLAWDNPVKASFASSWGLSLNASVCLQAPLSSWCQRPGRKGSLIVCKTAGCFVFVLMFFTLALGIGKKKLGP